MSLFDLFRTRTSAPVARERLQILLAHERDFGQTELTVKLHQEILEVIAKHMAIDRDKVQVKVDHGNSVSTLEIDIEMPSQDGQEAKRAAGGHG